MASPNDPILRMSVQKAPTDLLIPRVQFDGDKASIVPTLTRAGSKVIVLPIQKAPGIYYAEYLDYATMMLSQREALIGFITLVLGQDEEIVRNMVEELFSDDEVGLTQTEWVTKHTNLLKTLKEG